MSTRSNVMLMDIDPWYHVEVHDGEVKVRSDHKYSKGRYLSCWLNSCGYPSFKMWNRTVPAHHLVAQLWIGPRLEGLAIDHIDGNKLNNDPSNLEYVTWAENIKRAVTLGLHVASDPSRSGRYKDGRCANLKEYKHNWYVANKHNRAAQKKEQSNVN